MPRNVYKNVFLSSFRLLLLKVHTSPLILIFCTASEKCITDKRKTINGEDILNAQQALGFDNYYSALKIYLVKYRENCKAERANSTFATKEKIDFVQHRTVGQIPRTIEPAVGALQKLDEEEYIIY